MCWRIMSEDRKYVNTNDPSEFDTAYIHHGCNTKVFNLIERSTNGLVG